MQTCSVVAKTQEELRHLIETKCAELIAQGKQVLVANAKRSRQTDMFNWSWRQTYEATIITE